MGGVFSSGAGDRAVTATSKNNERQQRRLIAPDGTGGGGGVDYWSGLPEDLLLTVMSSLDVPGLVRSGAVCASLRAAYATFRRLRLPSPRQAPCLLYTRNEHGPNGAAGLDCPSTGATFRLPFPGPPHDKRGRLFSSNGLVFATDEAGDPHLLNPVTGARAALPPVKTLPGMETFFDNEGKHVWAADASDVKNGFPSQMIRARDWAYLRVAISGGGGADAATCTVLVVHMWNETLAFARPGDERWTSLSGVGPLVGRHRRSFRNVIYNDKDGLFYALHYRGSVYAIDLDAPSRAVVARIMPDATMLDNSAKYLSVAPSGDLLQMWRIWNHTQGPAQRRFTFQDAIDSNKVFRDHVDNNGSTGEDDDDVEERRKREMHKRGLITTELLVFKVDVCRQKLVRLRGIGDDHALFLGDNSGVCLATKGFPAFRPNCAYLTDDCHVYCPVLLRGDMGIWSFKERRFQNLDDAWPGLPPWLDSPAPIWITPSLC